MAGSGEGYNENGVPELGTPFLGDPASDGALRRAHRRPVTFAEPEVAALSAVP